MQKQGTPWHCLAALAVLASCGPGVFAGEGGDKKDSLKPLPPDIARAWRDAGAEAGWMKDVPPQRTGGYGYWRPFREKVEPEAIPAFRFHPKNEEVLAKLPDPGVPFGLDLHCTQVTGPWLKNMAGLKSLRSLNIGGSLLLTDQGLKEVSGLKNLQGLYLFYAHVTDAGLKELAGLKDLQALDLSHTQVKGAGLKDLAGLKNLQALNLASTKVTDAGLKELAGLKSLQALNLASTNVTDAGLKELAGLKSLQWLNLRRTQVTAAGVAALQKHLPACKILPATAEPDLTPEACKKALLEMMRSKPGQALGFFDKKLADDMEKMDVEKKKDEYQWTGAYRFNPPTKATYVLFVGIADDLPPLRPHPKGYLILLRVYQGAFEMKGGRWIATVPKFKYNLLD